MMKDTDGLARKVTAAATSSVGLGGENVAVELLFRWCPVGWGDHLLGVDLDGAGRGGVDADSVGAEFAGEGAGEPEQAGFSGAVGDVVSSPGSSGDAADVDDPPPAAG